jgi:hypothetical protein
MGHIQQSQPGVEPLLKSMSVSTAKGCDAKTLAVIAAQFIAHGDDEQDALRKANALYLKASAYTKEFTFLPLNEKEIEAFPEEALMALGEREGLAIGDSEANSPALDYFRASATTKLDKNITHKKFLEIIEREFDQRKEKTTPWAPPEKIAPLALESLHARLRVARSRARSGRRKKSVE